MNTKVGYKTNNNLLHKANTAEINITLNNRNYKVICADCNILYVDQTNKTIMNRCFEHLSLYEKRKLCKPNLVTHAINTVYD